MGNIYNNIVNVIIQHADEFTQAGLPVPKTIDVYKGQPSSPEQFEFALPAVFVDYSADYNGEVLYIYLHVLQDFGADTENFAPNRDSGIQYFHFLTLLKSILNGIKTPPVFGALKLYQEVPIQTEFYDYHQIMFRCTLNSDIYPEKNKYNNVEFTKNIAGGRMKEKK